MEKRKLKSIILVVGALAAASVVPNSQASSLSGTQSNSIVVVTLSVKQANGTAIMSGFGGQGQDFDGFKATSTVNVSLPQGLFFKSKDEISEVPNNDIGYMHFSPSNEFYSSHQIQVFKG